ncbi:MAG: glycosyltransferase family 4 protein [Candidatus Competibacteraceae bacterium]
MKILVFSHQLIMGGTVVNAIELATALRDLHGFDVVLFASPGSMVTLVEKKGLRYLPAPDARFHPTLAIARALRNAVRSERPDLIHAWDWWQCVDAYYAAHILMRIPMVVTDMSMNVTRLLPKALPTTWGTPELVDQAKAAGRQRVKLLVPPVDVHLNAPNAVDSRPFRDRYGIEEGDITLVTVSRLDWFLKGESLVRTIDAVRTLGHDFPLRLVIVGEGTARAKLERLADDANAELARPAVVLTGALLDPRPAYAAADIVVGMGGSALRGMAFGKPVVIVGEQNFSTPLTPETAEFAYYKGMYGRGDGSPSNARLEADIRGLAEHPDQFPALGEFSRQFVLRHFSLEAVSSHLAEICRDAVAEMPPFYVTAADGLRTAALYLRERRFLTPSRDPKPI